MRRIIWLSTAAAVVVLLAVVICVAVFLAPSRAADIWTEIAKACIQLVVVVGLGGIVGVVLRSIDERRDERRARDERRFAIFQELVDAYHRIKLVRRRLRTVGLRAPGPERLRSEQLKTLREGMTTIIKPSWHLSRSIGGWTHARFSTKTTTFGSTSAGCSTTPAVWSASGKSTAEHSGRTRKPAASQICLNCRHS